MTKLLSGAELVAFIQERQARQVRSLRQTYGQPPKLVIIQPMGDNPVIDAYVRRKREYGDEIVVETVVDRMPEYDMAEAIAKYNADGTVHGIIVQLPLDDASKTDEIVARIAPEKDVDGLGPDAAYVSATADAIQWLLAGYGIDLPGKRIAILGHGRLVGAPLARMWRDSGYLVQVLDEHSQDIADVTLSSDIIVTATGVPGVLTSGMVPIGATVVDAGTASDQGVIVGDAADDLRERDDIAITPRVGGVGPLTVALLYDHVIQAALKKAGF